MNQPATRSVFRDATVVSEPKSIIRRCPAKA
jgi:hypothetical protein